MAQGHALAWFQCDTLLVIPKHAKGMSLRYDVFFHLIAYCDLNYYYKRVEKFWKKKNKSLSLQ